MTLDFIENYRQNIFVLHITRVTGMFACNNSSLYRKQTCQNILKPETARTNSKKKITANQN